MSGERLSAVAALLLAGCNAENPADRRARMLWTCQNLGGAPLDCVKAIDQIERKEPSNAK